MSFSYNVDQLASSKIYQVRYKLGDTVEQSAFFQDEEIQFSLDENVDDVLRTCIACVTNLLPRLAVKNDFKVGPYSESMSSKSYDFWSKLLTELKAQVSSYQAPTMLPPTTPPLFYYNMMGVDEDGPPTDPLGCD
jgi:hypothetical protein